MNLHTYLKTGTRQQHAALEHVPVLQRVLSPQVCQADYVASLQDFFGFYAPLERLLRNHAGWHDIGWNADSYLYRTGWLLKDLLAMGYSQTALQILPRCRKLPQLKSGNELLGLLYVTEGSVLGGRSILAHLQTSLPEFDVLPHHFYAGHGEHTLSRWQRFLLELEQQVADSAGRDQVLRGAEMTFMSLEQWIKACSGGDPPDKCSGL